MRTSEQYLDSLRNRDLEFWVDGVRVSDPVAHPKVRPSINAVAMTYALAHEPAWRDLATAHSDLIDGPVNRFTHLFREPGDLVAKLQLQRELGRRTGTCFQRCVGLDGINALFIATHSAGTESHARFRQWLIGVQRRDEVICGAMSDAKGDRSKRPVEQPDAFTRIVERRADGVVLRGAKLHQTGAANSHWILVLPGQGLRPGEEDFAFAVAVPVDAAGVVMILGRQPSDGRRGTVDDGNARYGGQEVVVIFDDVFVPWERVFLDRDPANCALFLDAFSGYHRASYGGCKPGNLDVLIGAVTALTQEHGVRDKPAVRDKLVEMVHLTETVHGLGLAASHKSTPHKAGVWLVDRVLANVCKQHVTRLPYEIGRLAEDLAGGLLTTMPSLKDLDHPRLGRFLKQVVGSRDRARLLRLVEWFTYGAGAVPLRIECMHGAGSPAAQRIVLERHTDWDERVALARRLAGLDESPEPETEPVASGPGPSSSPGSIHQEISLNATPDLVYEALMDSGQHGAFTAGRAEISRDVGGAFSCHGGAIVGRNIALVPNVRIVQAWRVATWAPGVYSIVRLEFRAQGQGTLLVLDHTGVPEGTSESLASGWHARYWEPLARHLG
jgi:4-hydroxybutyryl-CoA dehydratase/vinylacetyl-CoA-Delta-isomerase